MKFILTNLIFLFYLFPLYSNVISVKGLVVDHDTGLPIQYACVFIANTTIGTTSNDKGQFLLSFLNGGISNLVVSHVSYQTFITNITENEDSINVLIKLKPQAYDIEAVNIKRKDSNRKYKINLFSEGLLGQSNNALSCRILNPSVLNLIGKRGMFSGWNLKVRADSMLIIRNKNLGYTIKYDLVYFEKSSNSLIYFGYPFYSMLHAFFAVFLSKPVSTVKVPFREFTEKREYSVIGFQRKIFTQLQYERLIPTEIHPEGI